MLLSPGPASPLRRSAPRLARGLRALRRTAWVRNVTARPRLLLCAVLAVTIGLSLPREWAESFDRNELWDALPNANIEGGHYVLGVGRRSGYINLVTWGRQQLMTAAGYEAYNDETLVYLDEDKLVNGKDL